MNSKLARSARSDQFSTNTSPTVPTIISRNDRQPAVPRNGSSPFANRPITPSRRLESSAKTTQFQSVPCNLYTLRMYSFCLSKKVHIRKRNYSLSSSLLRQFHTTRLKNEVGLQVRPAVALPFHRGRTPSRAGPLLKLEFRGAF